MMETTTVTQFSNEQHHAPSIVSQPTSSYASIIIDLCGDSENDTAVHQPIQPVQPTEQQQTAVKTRKRKPYSIPPLHSQPEEITKRTSQRRVTKTKQYDFEFSGNEEQLLIQQALRLSRRETKREVLEASDAPVFRPTLEEFVDPLQYIEKIRAEAEPFGICKIVPPPEWKPQCQIDMTSSKRFPTKLQQVNTLQEGQGFDDGRSYTLEGYRRMADEFHRQWSEKHHGGAPMSQEQLARDYWEMVETNNRQAAVEYGNDLDTSKFMSGFPRRNVPQCNSERAPQSVSVTAALSLSNANSPNEMAAEQSATSLSTTNDSSDSEPSPHNQPLSPDFYVTSGWNLNNIPTSNGSVLRYLEAPVNGVNVPWLYLGMLFATFCWHNEDNYCYSISYNHFGASKQWYGVAGINNIGFEKVMKEFLLGSFRESPDLMHQLITQLPPSLLIRNGIPVCKATQDAGTFIVTFPKAYHAGFSYGFNCGEAVNFASYDWLKSGAEAIQRYRSFSRDSVFSHHRLLFTLWENRSGLDPQQRAALAREVENVVSIELYGRKLILEDGVRTLPSSNLPSNNFSVIDDKAMTYDESRCCSVCKQACVFSCVVCSCDKVKVSCVYDYNSMCSCAGSNDQKFLLTWASNEWLQGVQRDVGSSSSQQ